MQRRSFSCDEDHQDFQQCLDSCPTCTSSFLSARVIFRLPHDALRWSTRRDESDAARHAHPGARGHQREHYADAVFFLDLHFSSHCRHAGRREGFLGTPPLAPRPAFSPFSLLSPPSFPLLPPLPRAWVWVDVGWEGGKEGSSSSSPASLPPHVHSTLA